MNGKEKLLNLIRDNEALGRKLEEAWTKDVSIDSIKALFAEADVKLDEDVMQELLAMIQLDKLSDITTQEMDDEQLNAVAGGGSGICDGNANCDNRFTIHNYIPKKERCHLHFLCDYQFHFDCYHSYAYINCNAKRAPNVLKGD